MTLHGLAGQTSGVEAIMRPALPLPPRWGEEISEVA